MSAPQLFHDGRVALHAGDCLEVLDRLPAASVDAICTDPPYELGFMGKAWDSSGVAFRRETWAKALRVLKPGGYLVAFSAPRCAHRMACAIEDAGFEVRDSIVDFYSQELAASSFFESLDMAQRESLLRLLASGDALADLFWCFGTGFPKSLDVSKAIGGAAGAPRDVIATEKVRDIRNGNGRSLGEGINAAGRDGPTYMQRDITAPATDAARKWAGWGTALKPAYEPICLARKPLDGTVAANVLKWGTGAINVDGCRIEAIDGVPVFNRRGESAKHCYGDGLAGSNRTGEIDRATGRFPANVCHDASEDVAAGFPESAGQQGDVTGQEPSSKTRNIFSLYNQRPKAAARNDSGSAARFFYSAKAGADDRLFSKHPTVKPVALMRWLVRLVTPPGGTVLDLFAGTGTTGHAALLEGFNAILIEREAEYRADIERRMLLVFAGEVEKAKHGKTESADALPLFGGAE
jgi:DNA modification methylase